MKKNDTIKSIFVFLLYFITFILAYLTNYISNRTIIRVFFYATIILEIALPILLIIIFRKLLVNDFKSFKTNYKEILKTAFKYWGLGLLAMAFFNYTLHFIVGSIATNEELNRGLIDSNVFLAALLVLIYAPFTEELLFRANFKRLFNNIWKYVIFSGLLFASLHVATAFLNTSSFKEFISNWKQLLFVFPYVSLGIAFALAYYKTDNIYSSMIVHFTHNLLSLSIILLSLLIPM